ncbi:hypothetical protein GC387_02280 [Pseudomonas sp. MWU12-2323]|nr:hypothetical protein [Pseudomonas sp. MWU12-2323]RBH58300.1 hypothetical protein C3F00_006135 [Pseudomonas sp. MWU13-2860]
MQEIFGESDVEQRPAERHLPVGAWLAREEALTTAKSFAGKPCSYRLRGVTDATRSSRHGSGTPSAPAAPGPPALHR